MTLQWKCSFCFWKWPNLRLVPEQMNGCWWIHAPSDMSWTTNAFFRVYLLFCFLYVKIIMLECFLQLNHIILLWWFAFFFIDLPLTNFSLLRLVTLYLGSFTYSVPIKIRFEREWKSVFVSMHRHRCTSEHCTIMLTKDIYSNR